MGDLRKVTSISEVFFENLATNVGQNNIGKAVQKIVESCAQRTESSEGAKIYLWFFRMMNENGFYCKLGYKIIAS